MRPTFAGIAIAILLFTLEGSGQSFDVASVKPMESGRGVPSIKVSPGGRLTATNVTLRRLIRWAYGVQDFQITSGPNDYNQPLYEVLAKGERGNETVEQLSQALQTLLTDRFKLKLRRETKLSEVYALTATATPSKLREVPEGAEGHSRVAISSCGLELTFPAGASLTQLASFLSAQTWLEHPVINRTGLSGIFDIKLQFFVDGPVSLVDQGLESGAPAPPPPSPSPPPPAPGIPCARATIFAAVQNQLGLKLERQRAPVEMFVIDHWEKPSENE
jgi:uncharacterized protein (TIGR03435 family)